MTNNAMPEYIFAEPKNTAEINPYGRWEDNIPTGFLTRPTLYVRADLSAASAKEPLEDGQTRWIKPNKTDGWVTATVEVLDSESDRFMFSTAGEYDTLWFGASELYKIGPVIHPPVG